MNQNLELNRKTCWWIVVLIILQQFLSINMYVLLCMACTFLLGIKYIKILNKYKPYGIFLYIIWGIFAFFWGWVIERNSFFRVLRSTEYWLNGVLTIVLGMLLVIQTASKYDLLKTLTVSNFIISIYCFVQLVVSGGFLNYITVRTNLSINVVALEAIVPIYFIYKAIYKETIVSRKLDPWISLTFLMRVILCFSRTTIIGVIITLVIYVLLMEREYRIPSSLFIKVFIIIIVFYIAINFMIKIMPSGTQDFLNKFTSIFSEVDTDGTFNNYAAALSNWRGYENWAALQQFSSYDITGKLIGNGFGGLVHVQYVPSTWKSMEFYQDGGIPLLHNGFFTVLCLGGLFGIFSYLRLFIGNIFWALRKRKFTNQFRISNITIVLCVMMLVNTYVIRGLFSETIVLTWGILFCEAIYNSKRKVYGE